MHVVKIAFQENVNIDETSVVYRQIEDIRTLAHELSAVNEVEILRKPEDNENNDDFVNDEVEWESKDKDNEE